MLTVSGWRSGPPAQIAPRKADSASFEVQNT